MTDEVERVARALWFDFVDQRGYPNGLPTWDEMVAWPTSDRNNRCAEFMSLARAAIAVLPTTFTGPWVKEIAEDGTVTVTDVGETDIGNKHVYSAEDVKRLFGGGE